ncbi:hypothetical protein Aperf_G00000075205 [Anoplocephala perfoliata]
MEHPISEGFVGSPIASSGPNKPGLTPNGALKFSATDQTNSENTAPITSPLDGCTNTASILLEPSEYFFDDEFAVPFDANLRDESSLRQQDLIDDSDEGISSSGLLAPPHSRSDSCLFTQPDSADCTHTDNQNSRRFNSPLGLVGDRPHQNNVCCPDSTSAADANPSQNRKHRTLSADFSTVLQDMSAMDKLFDNYTITFSEHQQQSTNLPPSVTASWMQTMLEGSCCPRIKELLKRTAEALDYRLAWGEIQIGLEDGSIMSPSSFNPKRFGRIQRSTSHGNIFTAASLAGMRRALANVKITAPKTYRSVGVSTSDCSAGESSLPDTTTTATATTTWARIRSSRESLNNKKGNTSGNATTVIPSPPKANVPESAATWRAVKEAAGSELTTWGQLRRTASLGNRKTKTGAGAKKNEKIVNMHASLMAPGFDNPLRSPISHKAMHRYSGTLLEIFMRARARDLISSSCHSSTGTNANTENTPNIIRRPEFLQGDNSSANFSIQTNAMMLSLGTETEQTIDAAEKNTDLLLRAGIPPPKMSQPPCMPPRKSSAGPRRLLYVNRSGGACFASRLNSDLPDSTLLTMSADPESECMTRLREAAYLEHLKNPRAGIVYPGLGKLAIPKPSRIESNTFLSQTLPDLSLLGKAAAQEVKSGTPTTRVPSVSSKSSRRATSLAPSTGRNAASAGISKASKTEIEALRQRIGVYAGHRASDVVTDARLMDILSRKAQNRVEGADRSASEPDVIDSKKNSVSGTLMASSLTKANPKVPAADLDSFRCRPRSQSSHYKKSVSFNGNMHRLPEGVNICRSPDEHRFGSPDPKVIPKSWGIYGHDPLPLAVFQPSNDEINDVSSTTRPSDMDVRYHAMVMDVIRAVQETIAYFCQSTISSATPDGSNTTGSFSSGSASGATASGLPRAPQNTHYRCYSSLAALGGSGRSSLVAVVNPLMVLISDGLLPPQTRAIFATKPKSRIWALVDDSCRPFTAVAEYGDDDATDDDDDDDDDDGYMKRARLLSAYLGKIEHHILNEVLNQVKAITGAISEKLRFRAFVCACLNQRALLLWLNSLVSNDALLKRYYCEGAFIRQCRSALQGLYADLTTHIEQLLNYPFNFDLAAEAKRPLVGHATSTSSGSTPHHGAKNDSTAATVRKSDRSKPTQEVKETRTPFKFLEDTFGRASSTPASTTKTHPKTSSNGGGRPSSSSVAKTVDTKLVRPRVQPTPRRTPINPTLSPENQNPPLNGSPSLVSPLKPASLASPTTSAMRGKLRTAFSTFRRSTDLASRNSSIPTPSLVANKCSPPPPLPPHRTAVLSSAPTHCDNIPMRGLHPPPF